MKKYIRPVSQKGQVTIPLEIRRMMGLDARGRVAFEVKRGTVVVSPVASSLEASYQAVRALSPALGDDAAAEIAAEEHAGQVALEGTERR